MDTTTTAQPVKRKRGRPRKDPSRLAVSLTACRPFEERSAHGHLCSVWRNLAYASRRNGASREKLAAYVEGPKFQATLNALDPKRRALAMQAVARAYAAFGPQPQRPKARVRWTPELNEKLKAAAIRLPDNRALADELALPYMAVKIMRWRLLGKKAVPHISQRGPDIARAA
jgi:hypothetical protein